MFGPRLVRINREPNASDSSGGAANAQPSTDQSSGASTGAVAGNDNPAAVVSGNQSQWTTEGTQNQTASSAPNFKEIGDRLNKGEILSDEELSGYQDYLKDGSFDKDHPDTNDEEVEETDEGKETVPEEKDEKEGDKKEEENSDPILEAMRLTGAKKAEDLPVLIKGLRDAMTASGGELGSKVKTLGSALETQHNIMLGVANGDPGALAEFKRITGKDFNASASVAPKQETADDSIQELDTMIASLETSLMTDEEVGDSLDPVMARKQNESIKMQLRLAKMNHQALTKNKQLQDENLRQQTYERAYEKTVSDLGALAENFKDVYGITAKDVRSMISTFEKEQILHPKFAQLKETFDLALERGISFEDAHKIRFFDKKVNVAPIVSEALKNQRNKLLSQPNPNSISQQNNNAEEVVTMETYKSWINNGFPDKYMTDSGVDLNLLPKNIKKQIGLA
jgi:hypothetical protein